MFANIRTNKCLDRFTLRGKLKVNIQWRPVSNLVHNIEKVLNLGWPRRKTEEEGARKAHSIVVTPGIARLSNTSLALKCLGGDHDNLKWAFSNGLAILRSLNYKINYLIWLSYMELPSPGVLKNYPSLSDLI